MKLSRSVSYAVQAALHLAQTASKDPVPCSLIAAEGDLPERFLLQILRKLVNHDIIRSSRGVEGGYTLIRNSDEVSLLEIIEAIEGPLYTNNAPSNTTSCELQLKLQETFKTITTATRKQLKAIKLRHFLPQSTSGVSSVFGNSLEIPEQEALSSQIANVNESLAFHPSETV